MKKILLLAVMAVMGVTYAVAGPRAIGVNLGYGGAFSYQHSLGESNMIDLAVEVPAFNGIGASCTYDWIDPFHTAVPWNNQGEWHWYMGVGAGAGLYGWDATTAYVGAVGHVGIEYDFWFPMQLSLDWRPNVGAYVGKEAAGFNLSGIYSGIALGIRYKF